MSITSNSGDTDGSGQYVDSDGNRVNVGDFDSGGLNVNNNWNDNRNDNLGVASARQSLRPRMPAREAGILIVFLWLI